VPYHNSVLLLVNATYMLLVNAPPSLAAGTIPLTCKVSCLQKIMLSHLSLLLVSMLACMSSVHACGSTVLEQNFDKYSGDYQLWDKTKGQADMPGFVFLKAETAGNSMVGEQQYRVTNPKGTALPWIPRVTAMHVTRDGCSIIHNGR
jgi:hypothetical protein